MNTKLLELSKKLHEKKLKQDDAKKKYRDANKVKKLTATQKIDMIIEFLGIDLDQMD